MDEIEVTPALPLKRFLTRSFEYTSGVARLLIHSGLVTVNGSVEVDPNRLIIAGDVVFDGYATITVEAGHVES